MERAPRLALRPPLGLATAVCATEGWAGFPTFQSLGFLICKMGVLTIAMGDQVTAESQAQAHSKLPK